MRNKDAENFLKGLEEDGFEARQRKHNKVKGDMSGWLTLLYHRRRTRWIRVLACICWIDGILSLFVGFAIVIMSIDDDELMAWIVGGACVLAAIISFGLAQVFSLVPEMADAVHNINESIRSMAKILDNAAREIDNTAQQVEQIQRKLESTSDKDPDAGT